MRADVPAAVVVRGLNSGAAVTQAAMTRGNSTRSAALDAVRGLAIALVVEGHYIATSFPIATYGVDLFFALSGYLIRGILLDNRGSDGFFVTFYGRRAFRILPLYWVLLALYPTSGQMPIWRFLVFGQNFGWLSYVDELPAEPLSVTWSLALEEQFYLLLPFMVASLPRVWLVRVFWLCVIAAPLWRFVLFRSVPLVGLLLPCRLDTLMGGALMACYVRGFAASPRIWALLALVAPGLDIALHWIDPAYHLASSVTALLFVALVGVASRDRSTTILRPMSWLGIGAYSIYLFHRPVLEITGSPTLAVPIVLALAWASWRYVEAPLIRFARTQWGYRGAMLAPVPGHGR